MLYAILGGNLQRQTSCSNLLELSFTSIPSRCVLYKRVATMDTYALPSSLIFTSTSHHLHLNTPIITNSSIFTTCNHLPIYYSVRQSCSLRFDEFFHTRPAPPSAFLLIYYLSPFHWLLRTPTLTGFINLVYPLYPFFFLPFPSLYLYSSVFNHHPTQSIIHQYTFNNNHDVHHPHQHRSSVPVFRH